MATALIMSAGLGLASVLSDFARGGNAFESYIFGSISSVSDRDVILSAAVFISVTLFTLINLYNLLSITADPIQAKISGIKVNLKNTVFTILSAVTIGVPCKITGALMVTSLIILPVGTALTLCSGYKSTYLVSLVSGIIFMTAGITLSYHYGLKPGGAIVMTALTGILIIKSVKFLFRKKLKG